MSQLASDPLGAGHELERERARLISRRMMFRASRTAASASLAGPAVASQFAPGGSAVGTLPRPHDPILMLIQHATQGYSEASYAEARALGYSGWLEAQLAPETIDDSALDARLATLPTLGLSAKQLFDNYIAGGNPQVPAFELKSAALLRSILSRRQLYERMVEFWTDHFNIHHNNGLDTILKTVDDREVVRMHALGRFEDLLRASAKSAAMSFYLNNDTNVVDNINENYSREIMELHTLGVTGPYNEQDIKELARCFTGWAYYPVASPLFGEFRFYPSRHDDGEKHVLGQTIPAGGGLQDGEAMITFLAQHPSTATYVCTKLARWLLGYSVPETIIAQTAAVFLSSGGEIKEVLRVLLAQDNIQQIPWSGPPKLRRPFHFVCSLLRATGASVNAVGDLLSTHLRVMGHAPYDWVAPDGYPDTIDAWGSSVLPRWQFASAILSNEVFGVQISNQQLNELLQAAPKDALARRCNALLSGGNLDPADVAEVQAYVDSFANLSPALVREAIALAASSPSFQQY